MASLPKLLCRNTCAETGRLVAMKTAELRADPSRQLEPPFLEQMLQAKCRDNVLIGCGGDMYSDNETTCEPNLMSLNTFSMSGRPVPAWSRVAECLLKSPRASSCDFDRLLDGAVCSNLPGGVAATMRTSNTTVEFSSITNGQVPFVRIKSNGLSYGT